MADPLPTVEQAWSAVMADIRSIAKSERNKQQGFNFRGIDTVVDAVGPILRDHGVIVYPTAEDIRLSEYDTKTGTHMFSAIVKMAYTVRGPAGDEFRGSTYGEASDAGDKAVSKAQSVAYRVFLLQGLTIPTGDPEPDESAHQRGSRSAPAPDGSPPPDAGAGAVSYPEGSAKFEYANRMRELSSEQRLLVKAELVKRKLPSLITDMDDQQATLALDVLQLTFGGDS
jgi:hypothetical protein